MLDFRRPMVWCLRQKKKTLTQPSPAKAGEG
jgi:hypothetical protein